MKTWIKQLILLYLVIVILKIGLSLFILAPSAFSDDYGYAKVARAFFYDHNFAVYGNTSFRPPLYSMFLSLSYIFRDMEIVYSFMKIINAFLSSLIIFPAWLLSKEFFNEKKSMLISVVIAVFPPSFAFTFLIMPENLFFPLFLLSIYFIYKSFLEKNYKYDILAGITIGLTYLTKINAVILPCIVGVVFLLKLFKNEYFEIKKKIVMVIFFLIIMMPWFIMNYALGGLGQNILIGGYSISAQNTVNRFITSTGAFVSMFSTWFVLYVGYLMVATGFIFFITSFITASQIKNKRIFIFFIITISSVFFALLTASRHFSIGSMRYQTIFPWLMGGRVIGRYVEFVIPLMIINGMIGFKNIYKQKKLFWAAFLVSSILVVFASQLIFFQLFPINNMSLSWLGVIKFIFDYLLYKTKTFESIFSYKATIFFFIFLISIILTFTLFYMKKKLEYKRLLYIFIIFFSLTSLLNFCIIYYNTTTFWYNGEQTQLGLWFNKYDPKISTILFDERDGCKIFKTNQTCVYNPLSGGGFATVMGFWMNDNLKVGSVENLEGIDYVVSRHSLNLPLIRKTKNGIFLYKVSKS